MRHSIIAAILMSAPLCAAQPVIRNRPAIAPFILAGDRVRFDAAMRPQFTDRQIRNSAEPTRLGLALWAATQRGRELIALLSREEYEVEVMEDSTEPGAGRAPQPALPTLLAAFDHKKLKSYALVLNPSFFRVPDGMNAAPFGPASPAEMMAVTWAAEVLHIYFYSQGISLPHHQRADFQEEWRTIAAQLGMRSMAHDDEDQMVRAAGGNVRIVRWR